ncbi:efflux RND transporter permease subunit [Candidatus Entotheonella palauensis]|uniref:efflux RND transporter permease subunit n=1 Tax=Candidatus Entotheonella palauensis TaxID=93172 RepID=UPI000B7C67E7|nr:efflux RND transporter permease subunit [Candidatus Entotheonella palauensis]
MKLASLAVARPVTTCMFFLAIVVLGLISLGRLAVDQLPDVARPSITVSAVYEGAAPEIVERQVTDRLEKALATINNVKTIRSQSSEDSAKVTLDFNWNTDVDLAALDVREKVNDILRHLPEGVDPPRIRKFDPASWSIMYFNLAADESVSLRELYQYADSTLRYQLQQVPGVAAVDIWGGDEREIQILVDRSRLEATGLSLDHVVEALKRENVTKVGGHLQSGQTDYVVRPLGEFNRLEDIATIVLRSDGAMPIYLKDVAEVRDGVKELLKRTRVNRTRGLVMAIRKQSGTNTVDVSDQLLAKLPQLRDRLPQTMRLNLMFDRAGFIRRSIAQVQLSALLGGCIATLVLFLFLRSLRPTLIIALAIPLAVVATFILMFQTNISLNWMSLGGLALGIGMLVDNAVVVLENIFRHRQSGTAPRSAAIVGTREVGMAIAASTLTTLCVFFPLIFMQGMMGIVFQELALTVAFALLASLLVAITLVPMLSSRWLKQVPNGAMTASTNVLRRLWDSVLITAENGYRRLLGTVLHHRLVVLGLCLIPLVLSYVAYGSLGSELLPSVDEGMMYIRLSMPVGTRLEVTDSILTDIEQTVYETAPDVQAMFARSGLRYSGGGGTHTGFLWVRLTERSQRTEPLEDVIASLKRKLSTYPDAKVRIVPRPSDVARLLGASRTERLEVDVFGFDLQRGRDLAKDIEQQIKAIDGISYTRLDLDDSRPEMKIRIDRQKAAALGISVRSILEAVETSIAGTVASQFREGREEYDIRVRFRKADRQALTDLDRIVVTTPAGRHVPLRSLTVATSGTGPITIQRRGQERSVTIKAGLTGDRDFGSIAQEIEYLLASLDLPDGFQAVMAGERQEQLEANRNMVLMILLAALLVYMIMAALFESLLHPFVILCTLPFAIVGGIGILWFTNTNLSMPVYIGGIMLIGIAVNNGIVMIAYIQQLRQNGLGIREAALQGAVTRLRPILITTLTTTLALIPMAVGFGEGAEIWAPLGRVVVGGLFVAALFTLFFTPTLYTLLEALRPSPAGIEPITTEVQATVGD